MEDLVSGASVAPRYPSVSFWHGRRVLLTGHSGFKGAWLARMLATLGARVEGLALPPSPGPSAYALMRVCDVLAAEHLVDLRNFEALDMTVAAAKADIVFHLAAQALVGEGLRDPLTTFQTNVQGTVNLLEACRRNAEPAPIVVVTSDKVYRPGAPGRRHVESDPLGGQDPYGASKAACEHVVAAYRRLPERPAALATARAGNVIGGGDFGADRLIPDLIRADVAGRPVQLRQPAATRPFQHVLDVLRGYLLLAEDLTAGTAPEAVNFGPGKGELSVAELVAAGEAARGCAFRREVIAAPPFAEASRLALDSSLAREALGWCPQMEITTAIALTFDWYAAWQAGKDTTGLADEQIAGALSR